MSTRHEVNVVIPMAGEGRRFQEAGFTVPKPFIDVRGVPMIARVMENLQLPAARYVLIARSKHLEVQKELVRKLEANYPCRFVAVDQLTEGSACTVLFARQHFNDDRPMFIANSDQLVDGGIAEMYEDAQKRNLDGSIMTFEEPLKDPKWSYVRLGDDGFVKEAREKVAISTLATVGIYYFGQGRRYVDSALQMIISNDRVNREFYTCPVYNYLLADHPRVGVHTIPSAAMHGLGTPQDLSRYLEFPSREVHRPAGRA